MDTVTLEEMLDSLRESVETELESEGLASWTINASGQNFAEQFTQYETDDLRDLLAELREGSKADLTIDLSGYILDHIADLIATRESEEDDLLEDEEEDTFDFD